MADITVRRDEQSKTAPLAPFAARPAWQPFRMMRDLMGWDPFSEMEPFVPQVFGGGFTPAFEVKETPDSYIFKADIPGVKESDVEVTLTGDRLTVSGKRESEKQEQNDTFYTYERSYGSFTRSFTLPDGVDGNSARADMKDGVLTLSLKKLPEMQPKKIAISSSVQKS